MTWTTKTPPALPADNSTPAYVATDGAGKWVAGTVTNYVWISTDDGGTWTAPAQINANLAGMMGLLYLNGEFVAYGTSTVSGSNIYTSPDGVTWTQRAVNIAITFAPSGTTSGPTAAFGAGKYVIVGRGANSSATSADGITWTLHNTYTPGGLGFTSVCFDGTHFVAAVIDTGLSPSSRVAYSTDGATWTNEALAAIPGNAGSNTGAYFFAGKWIMAEGYHGGPNVGYYEVATSLTAWNGAEDDVITSTPGGVVSGLLTDNGTIALGICNIPSNGLSEVLATTDGSSYVEEDAGFGTGGSSIGYIAAGAGGFMAVGFDGSGNNFVAFRTGGAPGITVPDVVGDTQPVASAAIVAAGLMVGAITDAFNHTVPIGEVISQAPVAGEIVPSGTLISYILSLGPQFVAVPNVVGMTAAVANETIDAVGLITGTDSGVLSTSIPIGSVATQDPIAGTLVEVGTPVNLGISFVSPVFDVDATVISQYANSPTLLELIADFAQWFDPTINIQQFYIDLWNIDTAEGFGLDIWGRILGVSRVIPIPGTTNDFGFDNSDSPPDWENFGNVNDPTAGGPFFSGQVIGNSYKLNDDSYRVLLLTKAMANISATTAPALNALISNLFPASRGVCYTQDDGGMQMTYVFKFKLTTIENAILANSGVLSHPAGVGVSITVSP